MSKCENLKSYLKRLDFEYIPVSGECFMDSSATNYVLEKKNIPKVGEAQELDKIAGFFGNSNKIYVPDMLNESNYELELFKGEK